MQIDKTKNRKRKMDTITFPQNLSSVLIEIVKTGIVITDRDANIRFANNMALELLCYDKSSIKGKSIDIMFLPEDTDIFLKNLLKITREGNGFEGEALLRRKNGDRFFVNLSTALYKGNSNGVEFIIFTFQDITNLKEMEKESLGAEGLIGLEMMTDNISHQIRNPIVSIGGFALRLAREKVSDEEYAHYTRVIHDESRRLEYIIDRLVEFAKISPAGYAPLFLSEIIVGVEKALHNHLENSANVLFPEPETLSTIHLFGDLVLLIRAVQCIVQNAIEVVPQDEEVIVECSDIGNKIYITVKDNGNGISSKDLPYIFNPFFTTKFNHLGFGLTMAKRIIQEHKGQINVDSVPDKGTRITIELPKERRREIRTKLL